MSPWSLSWLVDDLVMLLVVLVVGRTNLEQTPVNRCQQLPAPYKRLIADNNKTDKQ